VDKVISLYKNIFGLSPENQKDLWHFAVKLMKIIFKLLDTRGKGIQISYCTVTDFLKPGLLKLGILKKLSNKIKND
jgi:hypothetical protein